MYTFTFSLKAERDFLGLDGKVQERLQNKLSQLKQVPEIRHYLKPVQNISPASHRIRIGTMRLLVQYSGGEDIFILKIGARKNIYKTNLS